ncbi:MAG TPA: phosphatase PAP2 family protein [Mycobacteriales bacterium]|nr:phosphatase PAP2 family protein [Mycobacteriales bacterium]
MSQPAARVASRLVVSLLLLGGVVVLVLPLAVLVRRNWPPLTRLDTAVTAAAERAGHDVDGLLSLARVLTYLGDPWLLTAASALLAVALVMVGAPRLAAYVATARVAAALLSPVLKAIVGRDRPLFDEPVAAAFGPSFPSGHALGAATFWPVLFVVLLAVVLTRPRWRWGAGVAAGVIIAIVAGSRVVLGVHYLSDVLAGVLIGLALAAICTVAFEVRGRPADSGR